MKFTDFLEFELIATENFILSVYNILITVLFFTVVIVILRIIKRIFRRQEKRGRLDMGTSHSVFLIIRYFLWVIAIAFSLDSIGIKITFLLASSAALLVGLGLGLQQIFQDFISGIALIIEGTLKVGDVIEMEDGEVGIVKEMKMRTSKIETRDNIILIVPNSKLTNDVVINWSHMEKKTRFKVEVGVAYGSEVELVKKMLLEAAASHPKVFTSPAPIVRFSDFGDSALHFEVLFYTLETFRVEDIKSDLRFLIDKTFRENHIRIPFPQRDVHLKQE